MKGGDSMSNNQMMMVLIDVDLSKFEKNLDKAIAALEKAQQSFTEIASNMTAVFQEGMSKSVSAIEEIGKSYAQLGEEMSGGIALPEVAADGGMETQVEAVEQLQEKFSALSSSMGEAGGALTNIGGLIGALEPIGEKFNIEGLSEMGTTLSDMGGTLATVSQGMSGLQTAFTLLGGPIGIIIAVIAVLALALYELWNNNEAFREAVLTAWASIQDSIQMVITNITIFWEEWGLTIIELFTSIWEGITEIISAAVQIIMGIIDLCLNIMTGDWQGAKTSILNIVKALYDGIVAIIQVLADFLNLMWTLIISVASTAWNNLKNIILTIWNDIKSGITIKLNELETFLTATWNRIITWATTKWTDFKNSFLNIWSGIESGVKGYINSIIGMINRLIDAFNTIQVEIPDWVPGPLAGKKFGINLPHVPQLARGGIIDEPTLAILGEQGKEAVVPLENTAFVDTLAGAVGSAVSNAVLAAMQVLSPHSGPEQSRDIVIQIEGKPLARVLFPYLTEEEERIGMPMLQPL